MSFFYTKYIEKNVKVTVLPDTVSRVSFQQDVSKVTHYDENGWLVTYQIPLGIGVAKIESTFVIG